MSLSGSELFLRLTVVLGACVVLVTEGLSLFGMLSFWPVLFCWLVVFLSIAAFFWFKKIAIDWASLPKFDLWFLLVAGLFLGVTFVIALVSPPNNYDSMTYVLPRVMHWVQNENVDHYATSIKRQLIFPPFVEYSLTHIFIVTGSDRFFNVVQWFFYFGSAIATLNLGVKLGYSKYQQQLAAVFVLTIPMAVLQASSTKNDLVLGFWILCVFSFLLARPKSQVVKSQVAKSIFIGAAIGLACFTKGTAYLVLFPVIIFYLFNNFKDCGAKIGFRNAATVLAVFFGLNYFFMARNVWTFGSPLVSDSTVSDVFSFPALLSNFLRNSFSHFGTPFERVNQVLSQFMTSIHAVFGIDPSHPATTFQASESGFKIPKLRLHEDTSGSPVHVIFLGVSFVWASFVLGARKTNRRVWLVLVACSGFFLLAMTLKWQPWVTRLHLPILILSSCLVPLVFKSDRLAKAITWVLVVLALPFLLSNKSRPLISLSKNTPNILEQERARGYFANDPALYDETLAGIQLIKNSGCKELGLIFGGDTWEYPWWILMKDPGVKIHHFYTWIPIERGRNTSAELKRLPCAFVTSAFDASRELPNQLISEYKLGLDGRKVKVWLSLSSVFYSLF